ncbi:MAG TPA: DUF4382 domain-containing protein [Terriglobia bacterium]|nr:DUF4382 domain-containing protein [Terriglobia bacterium]
MRTQFPKYLLVAALLSAAALMLRCGGNSASLPAPTAAPSTPSSTTNAAPPAMGSVVVFGQDAPVCDVISFTVTITSATLTPESGGAPVSVLASGTPVTVDFARLMDFSTILNFASVPSGTYANATLMLSNPQLVVLDTTKTPPAPTTVATTLTASTIPVSIQPALDVTSSAAAGLQVEFDLRKSVQVDANGQVTGTVSPVFDVSPSTESAENGLGEVDELTGLVQSVSTTSSTASFTGSFTLLTEDGSVRTVNTTSSTEFDSEEEDNSGLGQLAAGIFVEADVFVDANGNIVAKDVEAEEQEDESNHKSAFVGLVTSVTRDASGAATQFTVFVRAEEPDESSLVPMRTSLTVAVSESTRFKVTANGINEAGLEFSSTTLGVGQEVVVHGQTPANPKSSALTAKAVFLRLRSVVGNFSTLLAQATAGSGAFTLTPCGPLFQGQPITVITFEDTAFVGVSGVAGLTAQPTLVVKGLLFYEPQPITVNGVAVTTPGWVLEAKKVHQLNP